MRNSGSDKLGVSVQGYLARRRGEFSKNASVVDIWQELLPENLREACSLESISGGVVLVAVEPGPYMHELSMLSEELVQHLRQLSPQAGVRKIRLVPLSASRTAKDQER